MLFTRRRELAGLASNHVEECLLERSEMAPCLSVRIGRDHVDRDHDPRFGKPIRRLEIFAIQVKRGLHEVRREVRGKRKWQAQFGGEALR